ncbi:MAG: GNAT family N-acetyltransferase [Lacrimispora sp.]|uniref:GNAT family N-acetyltransferase n=1 Tax=Lacrimispora sp. TaxID=2719234 RepID=UPI0039E34EFF
MIIRAMESEDYDQVYGLWSSIKGFGIYSLEDSRESIEKFIKRNPGLSVVAEDEGKIVGTILSGHDGRRAFFYHVCVAEQCRKQGVGHHMALEAMKRLKEEGISKVSLVAFKFNAVGNEFWKKAGWTFREDLNYYNFDLTEENTIKFVQ